MQPINKILCITDLSNCSDEVLSIGVKLCLCFDACLLIFHTIVPPRGFVDRQIEFERGGERKKMIQLALKKIKKQMDPFDVKWESVVTYGDPVLELSNMAKKTKPDIILGASHGLSFFQQFFLGSVIGSMAKDTRHPFLVIPPAKHFSGRSGTKSEFANIIIACSLTKTDTYLKEYAITFSEKFHSNIFLVHVMESPLSEELMDNTCAPYDKAQKKLEETLCSKLNQEMAAPPHILHGVPGEKLALFAKTHKIDLIIAGIATHPGGIITTTTQALLGQLPCAVLAVPLERGL
jgi:nucleotide-binding universal stress UspA family protein